MKEKRSKRPQKWHLCQSQLFHTDVKKQPPMADTLSFNWKRSVRMSGWVFSSVTENSFSPNFASLPSLQTRSQIFLTDPERPQPSSAGVSGLAGPTKGKEGRRPSLGLGSGLRKLRRERTAFARTRGHRPHSTHSHDLRHGFQQRRLTFWPSLPSASLPGRDFLSIIDRRPAVELVGGSHRKVSLAGQALCSLKGIQRGALSCPLVWFFFFPLRGFGLRGRPGFLALLPPEALPLPLFSGSAPSVQWPWRPPRGTLWCASSRGFCASPVSELPVELRLGERGYFLRSRDMPS